MQQKSASDLAAITLRDIAKAAGVTIATASRSLHATYGVNPATRERVLAAAARLNYRPNRFARGLVTGRSQSLGLIISDIRNLFFAEVARGAEDAAYALGWDVVLCNSDLDPSKQRRYIDSLTEKRVDGIIMNSVTALDREQQNQLARSGVPMILLNRPARNGPFSTVSADNERGGRMAAEYLLRLGHRRLAHISGPRHHGNVTQRAKGFLQALRSHPEKPEATVLHGGHSLEGGYELAGKLFRDRRDITAIFAANDVMAFGVLRAALERGVRIPQDVSVVGFDNVEISAIVHPPLTTIHQPKYEIGQAAVNILLRLVTGKDKSAEHRVLGVELIERESAQEVRK